MPARRSTALVAIGCLALGACARARTSTDDGGIRLDGSGRTDACVEPPPPSGRVDLLFMMDNSGSLGEEQVSLTMQLPRFVDVLGSGDLDPRDGTVVGADFPPVTSLHVGVITSDMGTGGFRIPTCDEPNLGDDGILQRSGNTGIGCMAAYPTAFLSYDPGTPGSDAASFARDVECIALVGTGGCGFEQPLEAILKAVTPSTQPPAGAFDGVFGMGLPGNADTANAGFLRDDSLLVIVALSDEEDCSARDSDLFNAGSAVYGGDLGLRCFLHASSALHRVTRYVDGLLAQRRFPDRLVFAPIVGIPPDLAPPPGAPTDYDAILADDRMQEIVDPDMPTRLLPSCNVPGRGIAFPPRRFVELARELNARGATGLVQSACASDYTSAFDAVIDAIARAQSRSATCP
jgi:hypothetical protein